MDDSRIIELYWKRNESAISETEQKYGNYLSKIAYNILADIEDSRESVNDAYLRAWYSIPPHKPENLRAFLSKIVRRISIDTYRKKTSKKRVGSEYVLSFDELSDCVSSDSPEKEFDSKLLTNALNDFLATLPDETRNIFICRYFYFDSIRDIAKNYSISESKVKSILFRTRNNFKKYLEQEDLI